jgi:two-component system response regulator FixJ
MLGPIFAALEQRTVRIRAVQKARRLVQGLTPREREVLSSLLCGLPNKAIAARLDLSVRTVEVHRATMMSRLQVAHLSEALLIAFDAGLSRPPIRDSFGQHRN